MSNDFKRALGYLDVAGGESFEVELAIYREHEPPALPGWKGRLWLTNEKERESFPDLIGGGTIRIGAATGEIIINDYVIGGGAGHVGFVGSGPPPEIFE